MGEESIGCARPTGSVVGAPEAPGASDPAEAGREEIMAAARVGGKAPDFEAPAWHRGEFTTVKLSDYLGKWVVLCFYPGDFTFV